MIERIEQAHEILMGNRCPYCRATAGFPDCCQKMKEEFHKLEIWLWGTPKQREATFGNCYLRTWIEPVEPDEPVIVEGSRMKGSSNCTARRT